jgi:hypothetical protein
MDANLHQKMGVHHLTRVLDYAPFVEVDGISTVHLTAEDWQVVADTLFAMSTPGEILPDAIQAYRLSDDRQVIELTTPDRKIHIEAM